MLGSPALILAQRASPTRVPIQPAISRAGLSTSCPRGRRIATRAAGGAGAVFTIVGAPFWDEVGAFGAAAMDTGASSAVALTRA